jgi:capsular exopolysaccharide synthesis family protein
MDQSIRSEEDLLERTGLVAVGRIPLVQTTPGRRGELVTLTHRDDPVTEAYKALRTNLLFSTIERPTAIIVITSSLPDEGKSRTTANLAVVMAAAGHRTLVIDADFRRSRQHGIFGRVRNVGLSDVIVGDRRADEVITQVEGCPNLSLLASGQRPPNPSELLGSGQMKKLLTRFREEFTYVLVDTPPVNLVTDPCVLAADADATMLVVEQGRTTYPSLVRANQALSRVGANVIGVVFNKIQHRADVYYYDSAYYTSGPDSGQAANGAESRSRTAAAEQEDVGRTAAR